MSEAVSSVAARHKAIQAEKERKIKQEEQRAKRIAVAQAVEEVARQQAQVQSGSDNVKPVQTVKEPVHVEQQLTPPQVELNKYPFNFSAYIEATSKDEAIEKLREFKPKLIEFMEREGVHYGK